MAACLLLFLLVLWAAVLAGTVARVILDEQST